MPLIRKILSYIIGQMTLCIKFYLSHAIFAVVDGCTMKSTDISFCLTIAESNGSQNMVVVVGVPETLPGDLRRWSQSSLQCDQYFIFPFHSLSLISMERSLPECTWCVMIECKSRYESPAVFFKIKPDIKKICYNLNNASLVYFLGKNRVVFNENVT